ncbi:MAG: hypothetical protein HQ581_02160 [Planctomycetes bacterium]|nr:hypothetical protein [Planctomycetota bacterium]
MARSTQPETDVQQRFQASIDALSPYERVQRATAMFQWSREIIARRVLAQLGPMDPERLKWEVALRQYGADPRTRAMIERRLASVSD